jgi:hypothetical protein
VSTHKSAKWTASYTTKGRGWFRARKKGAKTVSPASLHKALGAIGLTPSRPVGSFKRSEAREVAAIADKRTDNSPRGVGAPSEAEGEGIK